MAAELVESLLNNNKIDDLEDRSNVKNRMNVDSDTSSDEDVPKIKKKRSTQSCRAVTPPSVQAPSGTSIQSKKSGSLFSTFGGGVYSQLIGKSLNKLHQPSKISEALRSDEAASDVEDDVDDLFTKKSKKNRSSSNKNKKTEIKEQYKTTRDLRNKKLPEDIVLLEDKDTDVEDEASAEEDDEPGTMEPTPPSTPDIIVTKKSTKTKKRVVKAMNKLEQVQLAHALITDLEQDKDTDCSIIEITTPTKSPSLCDMAIRIKSRSGIQRFTMNPQDNFTSIFQEMAEHERVSNNQVSFFLNDKRINTYDTPKNIGLNMADIIECYIRKYTDQSVDDVQLNSDDPDIVNLGVQCKDKTKLIMPIKKDVPMGSLFSEFCRKKGMSSKGLSFYFDGEMVLPSDTPRGLGLESDYCIDVVGI